MREMTLLESAYLEQTKKLAELTAALGLLGDEPIAVLAAKARKIAADRQRLLTAAARITDAGAATVGVSALQQLASAVQTARANESTP